jgi:hypothetical protein
MNMHPLRVRLVVYFVLLFIALAIAVADRGASAF